jgi:hypothetical protein
MISNIHSVAAAGVLALGLAFGAFGWFGIGVNETDVRALAASAGESAERHQSSQTADSDHGLDASVPDGDEATLKRAVDQARLDQAHAALNLAQLEAMPREEEWIAAEAAVAQLSVSQSDARHDHGVDSPEAHALEAQLAEAGLGSNEQRPLSLHIGARPIKPL